MPPAKRSTKTTASKSRTTKPSRRPRLLTSFRCIDDGVVKRSGFGRTLGLSEDEVLFESPDPFSIDQFLKLEFLLDENVIADATGRVIEISKADRLYKVKIELDKLSARTRRLFEKQLSN
jgi:hypothetical protein